MVDKARTQILENS